MTSTPDRKKHSPKIPGNSGVRNVDVAGSNPVTPIILQWHRIHVAVVLSSVLEQESGEAEEALTSGQTTIEAQVAIT